MTILPAKSGRPYVSIDGHNYILSPWIAGENPDFTKQRQQQLVAGLYGRFHRISQTITFPDDIAGDNDPVRTIHCEFLEKYTFLNSLSASLRRQENLNRVDRLILRWIDYFLSQAGFCMERLAELNLTGWDQKEPAQGFCHNDPAPANIIIRHDEWYLIDFELAAPGPLVKEATKLLVRILHANFWPASLIPQIIEAYAAEREFSKPELQMLPYLCAFPQSFWRLCSQRFQERLPWNETRFYKRLWEITTAEPLRLNCLRQIAPGLPEITLGSRKTKAGVS